LTAIRFTRITTHLSFPTGKSSCLHGCSPVRLRPFCNCPYRCLQSIRVWKERTARSLFNRRCEAPHYYHSGGAPDLGQVVRASAHREPNHKDPGRCVEKSRAREVSVLTGQRCPVARLAVAGLENAGTARPVGGALGSQVEAGIAKRSVRRAKKFYDHLHL